MGALFLFFQFLKLLHLSWRKVSPKPSRILFLSGNGRPRGEVTLFGLTSREE